jgi:outer membrane protein assembly factor BamB
MPFLWCAFFLLVSDSRVEWLQWGGPNRDFQLPASHLAATWPAAGPRQLWKRALGDGYSSVVTDGRTLYTLFKRGTDTVVTALDAGTGKTVWESTFDAAIVSAHEKEEIDPVHGTAPASTPVISGDRLFAITYMGRLVALDRASGRMIWSQELWRKHGGTIVGYGYTNSPLLYKDTIILPVGGEGRAMMAFRQSDGAVVWKGGDSDNAMSSPVMIEVDGEKQVVTVMLKEVLAVSPDSGKVLWRFPHANKTETNVTSIVWCPGNIALVSSAYDSGTRAIHLEHQGGKTIPTELWFNKKMRVHHGNMMQIGDYVYASSGDFGPAPVTALKISTGEIVWRDRSFSKANFLRVGDQVIVNDEDGRIALVQLTPDGMKVLTQAQAPLSNPAWTPPTLAGTVLFLRDRATIVAFDLG